MAQFAMVAYYILGGPYSIQMGSNVRMDLLYGEVSDRRKAALDAMTVVFLVIYLGFLLYGGIASTAYSLGYFGSEPIAFFTGLVTGSAELGFLERSPTSWRPYLWPIKTIMVIGIFLMLLQVLCELAKDILRLRGHDMGAKV
jgi:TRAP-type mannitol/chloroaromatic compound transport system permease small subunit